MKGLSWGSTVQSGLPASVKQIASRAQSAAKLRAASEAAVAEGKVPNHDLLAAFTAYLKLEETGGDAARLQVPVCFAPLARPMLATWENAALVLTPAVQPIRACTQSSTTP